MHTVQPSFTVGLLRASNVRHKLKSRSEMTPKQQLESILSNQYKSEEKEIKAS